MSGASLPVIRDRERAALGVFVIAVYLASVIAANWLTTRYGFVPVGFGEMATAGTFAAGGALVVRDLAQDLIGRAGIAVLIVVGAGLSFLVADAHIAVASAVAFGLSEFLDMAVYTPLRRRASFGDRRWALAVAAGSIVGALADTIAFLWIAFGYDAIRPALAGQLLGKLEVAAVLILLGVTVRAVFRKSVHTKGA